MIVAALMLSVRVATAAPKTRTEIVVGPTSKLDRPVLVQTARGVAAPVRKAWAFEQLLPIRTPALTPGFAGGTLKLAQPLGAAVCVLGGDPASVRWLAQRAKSLATAAVSCWVVNVENMVQWSQLRAAAGAVVLLPMAGDALVDLGLRHTPALIQRDGRIEGQRP